MIQENKTKSAVAEQLINCIDSAFLRYGETTSQVVFSNFETRFNLKKEDVATHIAEFEELIDDIFGSGSASLLIKKSILKELAKQFRTPSLENQSSKRPLSAAVNQILRSAD